MRQLAPISGIANRELNISERPIKKRMSRSDALLSRYLEFKDRIPILYLQYDRVVLKHNKANQTPGISA